MVAGLFNTQSNNQGFTMPSWNGQNKTRRRKPTRKQARQETLRRRFEMSYQKQEQKRSKRLEERVAKEMYEDYLDECAESLEDQYWRDKIR